MRQTVTIEKAAEIATEFADGEFTQAVEDAKRVGLQSLEIVTVDDDGGGEIYVLRPRSVMIAWKPRKFERKRISIPGGQPTSEVHMTLVYLGDLDKFDLDAQRKILGVVTEVAQTHKAIDGRINGIGRFMNGDSDEGDPIWLGGDFVGLRELREDLVVALRDAGVEWEDTYPDFQPHITIGYVDPDADTPLFTVNPYDTCIDNLTVYIGGLEYEIELDGPDWKPDAEGPFFDGEYEGNLYVPVLKAAATPVVEEEQRYTYGPWYVPDSVDLHKEWATRDHVQQALWKYVDRGDRDIRLQHNTDVVAGRWVELATVPFPVTAYVESEGQMVKHTYPAGTPFMGVIWEEWAWPLVKSGVIRGYSIGGTAGRIEVDMPGAEPPTA